MIGKPRYGLTWFRITLGRLQVKAHTKGEHALRFEATVHNAKELRCRRSPDNVEEIITRLAGIAGRFAAVLDRAGTGFPPDEILEELPLPAQAGDRRIAGIDLDTPRTRAALAAALALAPAPAGFTAAGHAARVRQITGNDGHTTRQAAYDLRKLRGKQRTRQLIPRAGPGHPRARNRPATLIMSAWGHPSWASTKSRCLVRRRQACEHEDYAKPHPSGALAVASAPHRPLSQ